MLLHVNDAVVFRNNNRAGIRLLFSGDHPEKRCFAMTVFPHQPHALFRIDGKGYFVKKDLTAKTFGQIFYADHRTNMLPNMLIMINPPKKWRTRIN